MKDTHQKFYYCERCGNLAGLIQSGGSEMWCCKEPMKQLTAKTTDSAYSPSGEAAIKAKTHLPNVNLSGHGVHCTVGGDTVHPMDSDHHISWIYLRTTEGGHRKNICSDEKIPSADFAMTEHEQPLEAYSYCNKHGLWKTEIRAKVEKDTLI